MYFMITRARNLSIRIFFWFLNDYSEYILYIRILFTRNSGKMAICSDKVLSLVE